MSGLVAPLWDCQRKSEKPPTHQDTMFTFLQTAVMSAVDMCTKRGISGLQKEVERKPLALLQANKAAKQQIRVWVTPPGDIYSRFSGIKTRWVFFFFEELWRNFQLFLWRPKLAFFFFPGGRSMFMRERGDKKKSIKSNRDAFPVPTKQVLCLNLRRA